MMFRLAFIIGQLGLGGAEQQLYNLLSGLDRSRFSPVVLTLGPRPDEYWKGPIAELGIPVRHVPRHLGRAIRTLHLAALVRHEKAQIVHSWSFHTNPYSAVAGRLAGVPVRLGSMRESYGLLTNEFERRLGYIGLDGLITNSRNAALEMRELQLTKARIRFVSNGVQIPKLMNETERNRLRSELGVSETDLTIGNISRLDSNKNHAMLLQTFAALTRNWSNLRLVIIGDGPLKTQLASMAEALGITSKVRFLGAIPGAARYVPAMDVCCMTSYTEGMPNLVMEAMAAGVPVVSTRCGDIPDLVEDGVSGYLVPINEVDIMSKRLDLLLINPEQRLQMGQTARQKILREFSVTDMARHMTEVYEEFLSGERVARVIASQRAAVL